MRKLIAGTNMTLDKLCQRAGKTAILNGVFLTALLLAFSVNSVGQVRSGSSTTNKKVIEQLFTAWNSRNAEKVVAAFGKDAIYEDVAAGEIHRGRDEIRKWVAGAFRDIENFKIEVIRSSYYKGGGSVEWVWSGTDKGLFKTGKSFSVRGVSVIKVAGGKVSEYREYYDFGTVMRQLGLMPAEK